MKKRLYLLMMTSCFTLSTTFAQTAKKIFVIDAGHGGYDNGTKNDQIKESLYTLDLAKKIQKLAKEKNIEVVLTRQDDQELDLISRSNIINETKPTLAISLHLNSAMDKTKNGSEVFVDPKKSTEAIDKTGSALAELISNNKLENRGLKKANFSILRNSDYPTYLLELGFSSNENDLLHLTNQQYQNQLVEKIVQFLDSYETI